MLNIRSSGTVEKNDRFSPVGSLFVTLIFVAAWAQKVFILRYFGLQDYRRHIGKQLNKGDSLHNHRSFITFGKEGQIRKSQLETETIQAGCLTLVANLVVLWNTRFMEKVIQTLRDGG